MGFSCRNCEDIAMSFLVANVTGSPSILVQGGSHFLIFSSLFLVLILLLFFIIICCIYCKLKYFVLVHFASRLSSNIQVIFVVYSCYYCLATYNFKFNIYFSFML